MTCPKCSSNTSKVIDARPSNFGIRRRRECEKGHRFTSHELDHHLVYKLMSQALKNPGFFGLYERELRDSFEEFVGLKPTVTKKPKATDERVLRLHVLPDLSQYDEDGILIPGSKVAAG